MRSIGGISALSDFRKKQLLTRLQLIDKDIQDVSAEYIHFINGSGRLSAISDKQLSELLSYGTKYAGRRKGELFLIVPRPGTISPWSSKATDIAINSGLGTIKRIERGTAYYITAKRPLFRQAAAAVLYDRMTESVLNTLEEATALFKETAPRPYIEVDVLREGTEALANANVKFGMAIAPDEIAYLYDSYKQLNRNPTDAELMMFAQVNSEHCRHKIFNATWVIDGIKQPKSLFKMIKNTYEKAGEDVLSAYSDNAAVVKGPESDWFLPNPLSRVYGVNTEPAHLVIKVETHNHPCAIEPFSGAATGVGGEIRDEGATGRGARSKMGLTGFTVSNLHITGSPQPWEKVTSRPGRIASALDIMIQAPLGGAGFANEYGRPNLAGYFRTFEEDAGGETWGYHKPLVIAGGLGNIRQSDVEKCRLPVGAHIIVLGGPAMLIGLGGGSGASMNSGESNTDLDFASVQRGNGEMERRAQEVINSAVAMGDNNPIISVHDIGAGGYSNALPELVHDSGLGARFELRSIPNAEPGMSPAEIWCNESQERYVLGVAKKDVPVFEALCKRERCPFAVVGTTTKRQQLIVTDRHFGNQPVNLPMDVLFGKPPKMTRQFQRTNTTLPSFDAKPININDAVYRVLHLPAVASKKFLITIGDRSVGGLTVRDQMVGPWQVPVSDVAVTASSFNSITGEAMAMGERTPLAVINAPASGRMAVGEAITNIIAAPIKKLSDVKLSANWMAAAGHATEDQKLFNTVAAIGEDFCTALGLTIPVGKDSLSMRTVWQEKEESKSVSSPVSLIITSFAPVIDTALVLTPQVHPNMDSVLVLIDLGRGKNRLGGSALAQVYNQLGNETPDADPALLKKFFNVIQNLNRAGKLLAYHDRSDGGLLATLCEMSFAGHCGINIDIGNMTGSPLEILFNEELGALIEVSISESKSVIEELSNVLGECVHKLGKATKRQSITITNGKREVYSNTRAQLEKWWSDTSYQMQKLRDNPECAEQEYALIGDNKNPGLSTTTKFGVKPRHHNSRPKIAIFREQGVNGQVEMAAAFDRAGFTAVDVHLNDLMDDSTRLDDFVGLAACGGFSYGDVLGAGEGWAKSILFNMTLRSQFKAFFERTDTFTLGVCNGCQMLTNLKTLIPGAGHWPKFLQNKSERFESRLISVKVNKSPSIFFKDMEGSILQIPVAHGEGRAAAGNTTTAMPQLLKEFIPLQYVDNYGKPTESYPSNPNGSPQGVTAFTSNDGRATIMMPHPERAFLTSQYSWHPADWGKEGPWLKLFLNAREWVEIPY